jgi:hypothetical protein
MNLYLTLCVGFFILRFRVYDVDTKFQNSREEVIVYLLPAFSFDLMFTFLNMLILFRCLSLTNSSFLVRQHVHCLRYHF